MHDQAFAMVIFHGRAVNWLLVPGSREAILHHVGAIQGCGSNWHTRDTAPGGTGPCW